MKRRLNMALPLIFAFVLTLLPFGLLEYNQYQRNKIQEEREVTRWEQSAGNYLQLFRSVWSLEMQINRRFYLLNKRLSSYSKAENIDAAGFMAEMRRYFPAKFMPETVYAGLVDKSGSSVEMLRGDGYTTLKQRFFKRLLDGLCRDKNSYSSRELASLNATVRGTFSEVLNFELLRYQRVGKVTSGVYEGRPVLVMWDHVKIASGQQIVFLMIFSPDVVDRVGSMRLAADMLGSRYQTVSSVLVPLRNARQGLEPVFDNYLDADYRSRVKQFIEELDESGESRDRWLPPGKFVTHRGLHIMREFIDYAVPYEIWVMNRDVVEGVYREPFISFVLRLFFYTAWILVFAKVLISGNPVGISLQAWLTLTFMVVGVLPLVVFYVAGLFHIDASAFRL